MSDRCILGACLLSRKNGEIKSLEAQLLVHAGLQKALLAERDAALRQVALTPAWQLISTAPKNATEVLLLVPRGGKGWPTMRAVVGHWASDLSGSEQPAFQGWFYDTGYGFQQLDKDPTHWAPLNPQIPERQGAIKESDTERPLELQPDRPASISSFSRHERKEI